MKIHLIITYILIWAGLGILVEIANRKYFAQVYESDYAKIKKAEYLPTVMTGPLGIFETVTIMLMYLQFKVAGLYKTKTKRRKNDN